MTIQLNTRGYFDALKQALQAGALPEDLKAHKIYHGGYLGLVSKGYSTVANGWVNKYDGRVAVEVDGAYYIAVGHGPYGNQYTIYRDGYVEFQEVSEAEYVTEVAALATRRQEFREKLAADAVTLAEHKKNIANPVVGFAKNSWLLIAVDEELHQIHLMQPKALYSQVGGGQWNSREVVATIQLNGAQWSAFRNIKSGRPFEVPTERGKFIAWGEESLQFRWGDAWFVSRKHDPMRNRVSDIHYKVRWG